MWLAKLTLLVVLDSGFGVGVVVLPRVGTTNQVEIIRIYFASINILQQQTHPVFGRSIVA